MAAVIGIDFGNYNTFTSFIRDMDVDERLSGTTVDLTPADCAAGIPSVYFYSAKRGEKIGKSAVDMSAQPLGNRLRYLKLNKGKTVEIDGRTVSYDDAIVKVIQHCVRKANDIMQANYQIGATNQISLACPASFSYDDKQELIELAERATLEDGRHLVVQGTICEPAAAALDYLAEFVKTEKETTVLVYDLGGGTFDLALVSVYPKGRRRSNGSVYYYDMICSRGIKDLGGKDFDDVVYEILMGQIDGEISPHYESQLRNIAEETKKGLTDNDVFTPMLIVGEDAIDFSVTRGEFIRESKDLVARTISATKQMIYDHSNQKPDMILYTGAASKMPMIKNALEEAFPEYRGKINSYRPEKAVSYGAARFGTIEPNSDFNGEGAAEGDVQTGPVRRIVEYDLGVKLYNSHRGKDYIKRYIKAKTEVPCCSDIFESYKVNDGIISNFPVYEATKANPNCYKIDSDYRYLFTVTIDHGRVVPEGHPHESRMSIDNRGLLVLEARDSSDTTYPFIEGEYTIELK